MNPNQFLVITRKFVTAFLGLALTACISNAANATTPAEQLKALSAEAGVSADAARGQQFFTTTHGAKWSCSTCHGSVPTQTGKHAATGKPILPMAPAFNPDRFTDEAKTQKWFRRNCNDIVGRECTASEKADILSWLMSLHP